MHYSFKTNLISVAMGIIIGLPISLYAANHPTPHEEWYNFYRPEPIIYEVKLEPVTQASYESYEMTAEDLAEEEYYDDLELIASCVEAEAGNQDLYGKRLVVDVILNRVDDPDFPDTIEDVIYQKRQFAVVSNGMIDKVSPSDETFEAVKMELENRTNKEVLFFTSEGFIKYGTDWKKIGDHYFSTK